VRPPVRDRGKTFGQLDPLHERGSDAEIIKGADEAQDDVGERHDPEVGRCQQACKQDPDRQSGKRADEDGGEAPLRRAGRA
jgi:hypothetical protein